jgi:RimJ/RimL family protein N-acetyltransferase
MLPQLRTARLLLHPASEDDLDALWSIWADPNVRRFLFDDLPVTRESASEVLRDCLALAGDGLGLWTVRPEDGAPVIGCIGLLPATVAAEYDPSLAGAIEPLVAFAPAAWHRGYATEALEIVVAHAFGPLGLPVLSAVIDAPNAASQRLVHRLGFLFTGEVEGPRYRLRTYRLDPVSFAKR